MPIACVCPCGMGDDSQYEQIDPTSEDIEDIDQCQLLSIVASTEVSSSGCRLHLGCDPTRPDSPRLASTPRKKRLGFYPSTPHVLCMYVPVPSVASLHIRLAFFLSLAHESMPSPGRYVLLWLLRGWDAQCHRNQLSHVLRSALSRAQRQLQGELKAFDGS